MWGDMGEMEAIKQPSAVQRQAQMCIKSGNFKINKGKCSVCCYEWA